MTDKIQKIKEWISNTQDGLMDANGNFEYPEHEGAYHILCNLDAYIDSLQEEPKFKIGDVIRFKGNETLEGEEETHKIVGYDNELYIFDDGTTDLFCEQELYELVKEHVSETNKVAQVRRCLEEAATTINSFIDEVIEQFNLKDKSIVAKEIQYRGVGLNGDFGENIHRSDDEVIYILKEDKTVGLIVIRRTEFNNAEITMVKTEERFKEKSND